MLQKSVASAFVALLASMISCARPSQGPSALSPESKELIQEFEAEYSVRIEFAFLNPGTTRKIRDLRASPSSARDVEQYLPILREEASKLPPQLFRCAQIQTIALVRDLSIAGSSRAALPALGQRTLIIDVAYAPKPPEEYRRWVFHHELFHFIDYSANELIRLDPEWADLNPAGFTYGAGGDRVYHDPETAYRWESPPSGFVSLYATMGAEEDKAETFAAMMTTQSDLESRCESDHLLRAKVALLHSRLRASCPAATTDRW